MKAQWLSIAGDLPIQTWVANCNISGSNQRVLTVMRLRSTLRVINLSAWPHVRWLNLMETSELRVQTFTSATMRSAGSVLMLNVSQTSTKILIPLRRSSIHISLNGSLFPTARSTSATQFTTEMFITPIQSFQSVILTSATTKLKTRLDVGNKPQETSILLKRALDVTLTNLSKKLNPRRLNYLPIIALLA